MINKNFILKSAYLLICLYVILVLIDIILPRAPKILKKSYSESQKIIQIRQKEDKKNILKDKDKYYPMIYTQDYNLYPLSKIVKNMDIIPLGTLPHKNITLCSEGYGLVKIKTDRFGFRNENKVWSSKNINTVIIGDSFVEGQCLQEKYTFVSLLKKNTSDSIIRLSQGGYSAAHYAFLSKIFLPVIKPKNVIMVFYENDNDIIDLDEFHYKFFLEKNIEDYISFKNSEPHPSKKINYFNNKIQDFFQKKIHGSKPDSFEIVTNFFTRFSKLKKYLRLTNIKKNFFLLTNPKKLIGSTPVAIDTLISTCKVTKCKTYFVLIRGSDFWDPYPKLHYANYKDSIQLHLNKYGKKLITFDNNEIDYLDKKYFSPKGPHHSIESNKIIAKKLYQIIKSN